MPKFCFSCIEDLNPILRAGLLVIFVKPNTPLKNTIVQWSDRRPCSTIRIATTITEMKHSDGILGTDLLEEQKVVLIHELIHAFHYTLEAPSGSNLNQAELFGFSTKKEYELEIDRAAYGIVKNNENFFESLVAELILNPNCEFRYEVKVTPFLFFHKKIISDMLSQTARRLAFGNSEQIKILRIAHQLGVHI
ncbi:MAG: hypothetical protein HYX20_04160 [Candidatus Yanofskybacteria bacterium]|nr:hypothetical protein [Candidatus Yanofskybacteria bacterium]